MVLIQMFVASVIGVVAGFVTHALGYESPWPVVIGVVAALITLGFSVIVVDGDMFD